MADRREEILARLVEVGRAVVGVKTARRNVMNISETSRPALIILDGDEAADDMEFGGTRPFSSPMPVVMTPEVFIMVSASAATVGSELNSIRGRVIRAVLTDSGLRDLVGTNGDIRYAGCGTALATGRSMEGEMAASFAIRYFLRPAELEG